MTYHQSMVGTICLLLVIVSVADAFVALNGKKAIASFSLPSTIDDNADNAVQVVSRPTLNKMSQALPFLKCPIILTENSDVPGNAGFDPLGFVQDKDDLIAYQEAEIKHARLAMLVSHYYSPSFIFYW